MVIPQATLAIIVLLVVARRRGETQNVVEVVQHIGSIESLRDGGFVRVKRSDLIWDVREDERPVEALCGVEAPRILRRSTGGNVVSLCDVGVFDAISCGMPTEGRCCRVQRIFDQSAVTLSGVVQTKWTIKVSTT